MMIECMAGKAAAEHGLVFDATPFEFSEDDTAIDYFGKLLHQGVLVFFIVDLGNIQNRGSIVISNAYLDLQTCSGECYSVADPGIFWEEGGGESQNLIIPSTNVT